MGNCSWWEIGKKNESEKVACVILYGKPNTPHLITKKQAPSIFQNGNPRSSIPHANAGENKSGSEGKLKQSV